MVIASFGKPSLPKKLFRSIITSTTAHSSKDLNWNKRHWHYGWWSCLV